MCQVAVTDQTGNPVSSITVNRKIGMPIRHVYGNPYLVAVDDDQLSTLREQTSVLGWSCKKLLK